MNIKQQLINKLEEQLKIEVDSRDLYGNFIEKIKDEKINAGIRKIRDDEIKHTNIVNMLIKNVQEYEKPVEEKTGVKEEIIKAVFVDSDVVLFLNKLEDYIPKVLLIVKDLIRENRIVYISYNKIPKYTKKLFQDRGINLEDITFINSVETESEQDITVHPQDLTRLSVAITKAVKKLKNAVVIVDTISGFSTYHDVDMIGRFVASMSDRARNEDYKILWIAIDEPNEEAVNSRISQLCDKTLKL